MATVYVTALWDIPNYSLTLPSKAAEAYLTRFVSSKGWREIEASGAKVFVFTDLDVAEAAVHAAFPSFCIMRRSVYPATRKIADVVHNDCDRKNGRRLAPGVAKTLCLAWFSKFFAMADVSNGLAPLTTIVWHDFKPCVYASVSPDVFATLGPRELRTNAYGRSRRGTFGGKQAQAVGTKADIMACRASYCRLVAERVAKAGGELGTESCPGYFDEEVALSLVADKGWLNIDARRFRNRRHQRGKAKKASAPTVNT